jgi:hypothetical protein
MKSPMTATLVALAVMLAFIIGVWASPAMIGYAKLT